MEFNHEPVLLKECIENLNINPNGIYLDGTLGGGGHSREIVKRLTGGTLVGIDKDINAINEAQKELSDYSDKINFVRGDFVNAAEILDKLGIDKIDGALLDLGVSSFQLDNASRGFSYSKDSPLDMRMDDRQEKTAAYVINNYSEKELADIIFNYGEERWAKRIAQFIVNERAEKPIETTFELVSVIRKAVPKNARQQNIHPGKRTFQAIRIEVNNELGILKKAVNALVDKLNTKGRLCIISFHSLEDRIIKNEFKLLQESCVCPADFPVCVCDKESKVKIITRKPIVPTDKEIDINHRARSAKLRVCERK